MKSFKARLINFMRGRNGGDELMLMLTALYVAVMFINVFARSWILHIFGLAVFVFTVYRFLSKNLIKRQKENAAAVKMIARTKRYISAKKDRREQSKKYFFKRCPDCKKTLRLPRVKGKHKTKCPSCGRELTVNILRDAK